MYIHRSSNIAIFHGTFKALNFLKDVNQIIDIGHLGGLFLASF